MGEGPLEVSCPLCPWRTYSLRPARKNQRQCLKSNLRQHIRRAHAVLGFREISLALEVAEIRAFSGIPNTRSMREAREV